MSEPVRLLALGAISWLQTQAIYHALAESMTEDTPDTLILVRPEEPYVCIGYHQSLNAIVDRAACKAVGLPVIRRRVGGGTTYLDTNQQFYQCIFHHKRMPFRVDEVYAQLLGAPVAVLCKLGLNAELRDGNEIEVDGQRIAGIGGGRIGEAVVVVGNILLDFDYDMMARIWRAPSEIFREFASQAMRSRITTLWSRATQAISADEIQELLAQEYSLALNRPVVPGFLTEAEQTKTAAMAEQLQSEEWLYLHTQGDDEPMRTLKISCDAFVHSEEVRIDGASIVGTFFTRNDVIERASLTGDLMEPVRSLLENSMMGIRLKHWREAIGALRTAF